MNANTRDALQEFVKAVAQLAFAASSIIGTDAFKEVIGAAGELVDRLDKDETIV